VPGRVESEDSPECAEKSLLGHVFGVVPVAEHAVTEAEDDPVISLNQQARGLRISQAD
jgi:hypothetical protein